MSDTAENLDAAILFNVLQQSATVWKCYALIPF